METNINGITYVPREKAKASKYPRMLQSLILMASIGMGQTSKVSATICDEDLVEEYKLIQTKQSKLSRAKRDWIEGEFNSRFEPAKKAPQPELRADHHMNPSDMNLPDQKGDHHG